jgi:uncharacterized membrane protein (UPF0127 family)
MFIDSGRKIAKIAAGLAPSSVRWTSSEVAVRWVVEVAAGTVARHGIEVGDQVEIDYRK